MMEDFSRHLDTIRDGIAQLESRLELGPDPLLEAATKDIRFGRDGLARIQAAHLEALEAFERDHPVAEPYSPDDGKERE